LPARFNVSLRKQLGAIANPASVAPCASNQFNVAIVSKHKAESGTTLDQVDTQSMATDPGWLCMEDPSKMNILPRLWLVTLLVTGLAHSSSAESWKVDAAHTTVGFSVSHLFTSVQGRFDQFDGTIVFDPADPKATVVRGTVEAASINTNNAKRDKHLRSGDFFDTEKFPKIEFESTQVTLADDAGRTGKIAGNLTIHGVTKAVVLDVKFLGSGKDPWGNVRAGFRADLTINRRDYGLNWNQVLEAGGVLVGDEIEIRIDVEGLLDS
jgi:polyisoprenoid-binding protein YceI